MDQKNEIVARLQKRFAGSSLPGPVVGGGPVEVAEVAAQVLPAAVPMTEEKKAMARIAGRYAHLDPLLQGQIEALITIERNYPIRGFLTDDQMRAGIIVDDSVREYHWPEFERYSRLFFGPAHEAICTVFQKELQAVARHYGKNQIINEEVGPYVGY